MYFPKGSLNKLWIVMKEIDLYDWIGTIGYDVVADFARYMGSFPNARLGASPKQAYERRLSHAAAASRMMTRFLRLLVDFKGNRKVLSSCQAVFSGATPYMEISNNKYLCYDSGYDKDDPQEQSNNDEEDDVNQVEDEEQ